MKKNTLRWLVAFLAMALNSNSAFAASVSLAGIGHEGFLSLSGINQEEVEPNTSATGSKNFDYPYYYIAATNRWDMVVAEPLSSNSTYAEESSFTVVNKTITDTNFSNSSFGAIHYEDSSLTGSGTESISLSASDVVLDLTQFSPLFSFRNVNNEFAWLYVVHSQSLNSPTLDLTFSDGKLSSIDGMLEIGLSVILGGNSSWSFKVPASLPAAGDVLTYDGTLTFSGNQFAFDINVLQDASTVFGEIENTQLVFNRSGTLAAIPEPTSLTLAVSLLAFSFGRRRQHVAS